MASSGERTILGTPLICMQVSFSTCLRTSVILWGKRRAGSESSSEEEEAEGRWMLGGRAAPWKSVWPGEPGAHLPPCCSLAPGAFSCIVIRRAFGSAMCRDRPKQPARLMYGQNKSSCSRNKDVSPCVRTAHSAWSLFFWGGGVGEWEGFHI